MVLGKVWALSFALAVWGDYLQLVAKGVTFGWFEVPIDQGLAGVHGQFIAGACCGFLAGTTANIVRNRQPSEPQVAIAHRIRFAHDHRGKPWTPS